MSTVQIDNREYVHYAEVRRLFPWLNIVKLYRLAMGREVRYKMPKGRPPVYHVEDVRNWAKDHAPASAGE